MERYEVFEFDEIYEHIDYYNYQRIDSALKYHRIILMKYITGN